MYYYLLRLLCNFYHYHYYLFDNVYIGIGINVSTSRKTLDNIDRIVYPASSLKNENLDITSKELLDLITNKFQINYHKWCLNGFKSFKLQYNKSLHLLHKKTIININNVSTHGTIMGIDDYGKLHFIANNKKYLLEIGEII